MIMTMREMTDCIHSSTFNPTRNRSSFVYEYSLIIRRFEEGDRLVFFQAYAKSGWALFHSERSRAY